MEYAKNDVRYLHRLKSVLSEKLEAAGLARIFELESKLLPIIARMEIRGFAVDTARMREIRDTARKRADAIAAGLRIAFGNPKLNQGSRKQLLTAFEEAGIKLEDTEEDTLSALDDPRARQLLDWRGEAKLSSNIQTLLNAEHGGRIHAIFNPLGTVTTANMITIAIDAGFIPTQRGQDEANFSCDWNDENLDNLTAMLKLRIRRDRPPNAFERLASTGHQH
jgi:DNA polymerase I-like protein with 3'-5' exonuclease and polymerase domains